MQSWSIPLVVLAAAAVRLDAADLAPKQYQINMVIMRGDPRGSREAGTIKIVAEPNVVTLAKRPATFISGGEFPLEVDNGVDFVPFGISLTVAVEAIRGDKIQVKLKAAHRQVEEINGRVTFHSITTHSAVTARLGESIRVQISKGGGTDQ